MKKIQIAIVALVYTFLSCNNDQTLEEDYIDVNGNVKEKLIRKIDGVDDSGEKISIIFNYNGQEKLSSMSDGTQTSTFNYNPQGELENVSYKEYPDEEPGLFNINNLYQTPYDIFNNAEVLEKDSNNNPIKILVYDSNNSSTSYIGEIIYDDKPNPLFYTLKSSSMLNVLDKTYFNFGYQNPELVKAKDLIPNNIFTGMIFKDSDGLTVKELQVSYSYDSDNYPIQGDVYYYEKGEISNYTINYYYK